MVWPNLQGALKYLSKGTLYAFVTLNPIVEPLVLEGKGSDASVVLAWRDS